MQAVEKEAKVDVIYETMQKEKISCVLIDSGRRYELGRKEKLGFVGLTCDLAVAWRAIGEEKKADFWLSQVERLQDKDGFFPYATLKFTPIGDGSLTPISPKALESELKYRAAKAGYNIYVPLNCEKNSLISPEDLEKYKHTYNLTSELEMIVKGLEENMKYTRNMYSLLSNTENPYSNDIVYSICYSCRCSRYKSNVFILYHIWYNNCFLFCWIAAHC